MNINDMAVSHRDVASALMVIGAQQVPYDDTAYDKFTVQWGVRL